METGQLRPTTRAASLTGLSVLTLLMSRLTGNQWLVMIAGAAVGLAVATALSRTDLAGLAVRCQADPQVASGEPLTYRVQLSNQGRRPLPPIQTEWVLPALALAADSAERKLPVAALDPQRGITQQFDGLAGARGLHTGAWLRAETTDALGLLRRQYAFPLECRVAVYPQASEPLAAGEDGGADPGAKIERGGQELAGLRAWRRGDETRSVHWRATARRGRLVVAERQRPQSRLWTLVITDLGEPELGLVDPAAERELASAHATWLALPESDRGAVLAWTPDLQALTPAARPSEVHDWFAGLTGARVPTGVELLAAVPPGCQSINLLGPPTPRRAELTVAVISSGLTCAPWPEHV